jgi:YcxB-like protein
MEISYRVKYRDLLWANIYLLPRTKANQIIYLLFLIFSLVMGVYIMADPDLKFTTIIFGAIIISIIMQVAVICLIILLCSIIIPAYGHYRQLLMSDIRINISEKEFQEETVMGIQISKWEQIQKVIETDYYILILISDICVSVIPSRVFTNDSDAHKFYIFAKTHWYDARKPNVIK